MEKKINKIPRVSIGMPVYNGEPFIREALDSLLMQTFTDFKLIISDNSSIDNTEAICREYAAKDARIQYVRWQENRGPLPNFRSVLDEAVGEYFMWAAHDDRWSLGWLEMLVNTLDNGEACVAMGNITVINSYGSTLRTHELRDLSSSRLIRLAKFFLWYAPWKANILYGLHRLQVLRREMPVLFEVWIKEPVDDNRLVFYILQQGALAIVPKATYFKREHFGSGAYNTNKKTTSIPKKVFNVILPIETILVAKTYLTMPSELATKTMMAILFPINAVIQTAIGYKNAATYFAKMISKRVRK